MFYRFSIFRRVLDAEMKEGTRLGIGLANKKEEKQPVNEEDEKKFWTMGLLGKNSAKSLLNLVYFYNGKLFGLRAGEHSNICLINCEIGDNHICFEENVSKTFHGGLMDLEYEPRAVKHVCHKVGQKHDPCLVDIVTVCILLCLRFLGKVRELSILSQMRKNFHSINVLNSLNRILPDMCKAARLRRKTAHCLRVTWASILFNARVHIN